MFKASTQADTASSSRFVFLNRGEYFRDLIEGISQAKPGDRVLLVTHDFRPDDPTVVKIVDTLSAAAARGVQVQFALDERTYPVLQRVPLTHAAETLIRSTNRTLKALRAAGAAYAVTNKTYHRLINRFSGRAHIKVAIINDLIYVGGCNLTDPKFLDTMVRWEDTSAAGWLHTMMSEMIRTESSHRAFHGKDQSFAIDPQTTLLLDAGTPRQSIIFDQALQMIDEAEEWLALTCQYFPNNVTARHIAAAHKRGVKVAIYYNHPSIHKPGFNLLMHSVVMHEKIRYPAALFERQLPKTLPYLHAKVLATEKGAMVGSHNYVAAGVNWGTAELTLMRKDPAFGEQAVQFLDNLIAQAEKQAVRKRAKRPIAETEQVTL